MGGEKTIVQQQGGWGKGSPPRGRGKVCADVIVDIQPGITPAWAGKSDLNRALAASRKDHPRVGGEKTKKIP